MIWPGMGDPAKRNRTIKFLIITAAIGVAVAALSSGIQIWLNTDNPLKVCINDRDIKYKISATLEVYVDKKKVPIPAKVGFKDGCQRALYTLSDDGTIYAAWTEQYPFEIGHFLWIWDFKLRDMREDKSVIYVDGKESKESIKTPLINGAHYRAEFISKSYDLSKERDFLPDE